jgi:hypothetical protein
MESPLSVPEINPLAVMDNGEVVALDGKITFDDNALFRHPDIEKLLDESEEDLAALWDPQIDGGASLAPVVGGEESRAPVFATDREPPALVAEPRELHLDHLGTPFEHGERRLRTLDEQTRLQHPNAVEQAHPTSDSRGPDAEVHGPTLVTSGAKVKRPYSPCS